MSDFYSILKQSIVDRGLTTPEERSEAYLQARGAMAERLWSYDPPLAEDEIDARIGLFDAAVDRIEEDLAEVFSEHEAAAADIDEHGSADEPPPAWLSAAPSNYDEDDELGEESYYRRRQWTVRDARPGAAEEEGGGAYDVDRPVAIEAMLTDFEHRSMAVEAALRGDFDSAAAEDQVADDPAPMTGAETWVGPLEDPDAGGEPAREQRAGAADAFDQKDAWPGEAGYGDFADLQVPFAVSRDGTDPVDNHQAWHAPSTAAGRAVHDDIEQPRVRKRWLRPTVAVGATALAIAVLGLLAFGVFRLLVGGPSEPVPDLAAAPSTGSVSAPEVATRVPQDALPVEQTFTLFSGSDPTVFTPDSDNPVRFAGDADSGHVRISTSSSSAGVRAQIGPGLASRLAGKTVRITIAARSAAESGAETMRFAYQSGLAISHWQTAELTPQFEKLGLVWRVPAMRTDPTGDYIIIEPGIPGDGTAAEVSSITIEVLRS